GCVPAPSWTRRRWNSRTGPALGPANRCIPASADDALGVAPVTPPDEPGFGDVGVHRLGGAVGVVGGDALVDATVTQVGRHAQFACGLAHVAGGVDDLALQRAHDGASDAVAGGAHHGVVKLAIMVMISG